MTGTVDQNPTPGRARSGTDAAVLSNVHVVAGGHEILRGVDLSLERGDLAVLVGPNGAGKSTVLRTLVGRIRPTQGRATIGGRDVSEMSGVERAGKVSWLPQIADVREPIRVLDLVAAGRFRFRESQVRSETAARTALKRSGSANSRSAAGTGFRAASASGSHWPRSGPRRHRFSSWTNRRTTSTLHTRSTRTAGSARSSVAGAPNTASSASPTMSTSSGGSHRAAPRCASWASRTDGSASNCRGRATTSSRR